MCKVKAVITLLLILVNTFGWIGAQLVPPEGADLIDSFDTREPAKYWSEWLDPNSNNYTSHWVHLLYGDSLLRDALSAQPPPDAQGVGGFIYIWSGYTTPARYRTGEFILLPGAKMNLTYWSTIPPGGSRQATLLVNTILLDLPVNNIITVFTAINPTTNWQTVVIDLQVTEPTHLLLELQGSKINTDITGLAVSKIAIQNGFYITTTSSTSSTTVSRTPPPAPATDAVTNVTLPEIPTTSTRPPITTTKLSTTQVATTTTTTTPPEMPVESTEATTSAPTVKTTNIQPEPGVTTSTTQTSTTTATTSSTTVPPTSPPTESSSTSSVPITSTTSSPPTNEVTESSTTTSTTQTPPPTSSTLPPITQTAPTTIASTQSTQSITQTTSSPTSQSQPSSIVTTWSPLTTQSTTPDIDSTTIQSSSGLSTPQSVLVGICSFIGCLLIILFFILIGLRYRRRRNNNPPAFLIEEDTESNFSNPSVFLPNILTNNKPSTPPTPLPPPPPPPKIPSSRRYVINQTTQPDQTVQLSLGEL